MIPILKESENWEQGLIQRRMDRYEQLCSLKKLGYGYFSGKEGGDFEEAMADFTWSEETGPLLVISGKPGMRLFPKAERLFNCSKFKKLLYVFLGEFFVVSTWWEKLGMMLCINRLSDTFFETANRGLAEFIMDWKYISLAPKEIRRVLEEVMPKRYSQTDKGMVLWEGYYSDTIGVFLEADMAYRYRIQDISAEVDQSQFKTDKGGFIGLALFALTKNDKWLIPSVRELRRIAGLLVERELFDNTKWKALRKLVLFLQISSTKRKIVTDFFQKIDLEKLKLSQEDRYWFNQYKDYNCGGLPYETRAEISQGILNNYKTNGNL